MAVLTSLETDASPLNFPLQSLVSDVTSAGNKQLEQSDSVLLSFEYVLS